MPTAGVDLDDSGCTRSWLLIALCRFSAVLSCRLVPGGGGAARCARGGTGSECAGAAASFRGCGDGGGWSGGCGQGTEPLPAGEEGVLPGPVGADLEDALAGVMRQAGRDVPDRSVSGSASRRSSWQPRRRVQAARSAAMFAAMLAASTQLQFTTQVFGVTQAHGFADAHPRLRGRRAGGAARR